MKKAELLIPVGNKECLLAAINNGADAVYLAGKKYGARAYSTNFEDEELIEAINICHLYGVKVYITVNTMIYEEEINSVLSYLKFLYENNVDAVIMQDNGLISLIRKVLPNLNIHVSTQAHNHNEAGINYYKEIGCTRVVFDRESSLESIKNINIDIEKEVFVYGALCICYSGNCLFSSLNGGRSANRGMCVGSCRQTYKLIKDNKITDNGYLLSTKDLNTIENLKEILDANIDSLKIEGRMKSKEYVAIVTKIYRNLIDNYYANKPLVLSAEDKKKLLTTYNREFTKGYLFNESSIINKKTSNHQGIKIGTVVAVNNKKITIKLEDNIHQEDAIRFERTNTGMFINCLYNQKGLLVSSISKGDLCQVDNKDRIMVKDLLGSAVLKTIDYELNKELDNIPAKKIPININCIAKLGKPLIIEVEDGIRKINIEGPVIEKAINNPTTEDRIKEQLSKLGNTPYITNNIRITADANIFVNIKNINELRREAIDKLSIKRTENNIPKQILHIPTIQKRYTSKPELSILTRTEEQLKIALKNNIDIIYTTSEEIYNKFKSYPNIYLRLNRVNETHKEYQNERLLCTEFGSILKYKDNNTIRSDYYLNVANDYTISLFNELKVHKTTLSIESSIKDFNNIKNRVNTEILVYGIPECTIIKNNIFNVDDEETYLIDNKNNKYKVIYEDNFTHIFNHKPINLINDLKYLKGFGSYRIELLNESIIETERIINSLKDML